MSMNAVVKATYRPLQSEEDWIEFTGSFQGLVDILRQPRWRDTRLHVKEVGLTLRNDTSVDALREFQTWLDWRVHTPTTSTTNHRPCISKVEVDLFERTGGEFGDVLPAWTQLVPSVLGHLLSLGSVRYLSLTVNEEAPELDSRILDEVSSCQSTKILDLTLETLEESIMPSLLGLIRRLPLEMLGLTQMCGFYPNLGLSDPSCVFPVVRKVLDTEASSIRQLQLLGFNLATNDGSFWNLLATNRNLKELSLLCRFGGNTVECIASAVSRNTCLRQLHLLDRAGGSNRSRRRAVAEKNRRVPEGLRDSDVHHLAMALKQNGTLTELWLWRPSRRMD